MNGPEIYATVFASDPARRDVNVIWAGSDDGLVHVTRDGGKTWANVTPKEMPEFGRVSQIDASAFDAGAAYIAVKKPLLDDFAPYIFRTHDYGRTWTKIVNGIPAERLHARRARGSDAPRAALRRHAARLLHLVRRRRSLAVAVARTCPTCRSPTSGSRPTIIAIATHGRGFWVLDDVAPLRQSARRRRRRPSLSVQAGRSGPQSAYPAQITYWLKKPPQKLTLEILDAQRRGGAHVRRRAAAAGRGGAAQVGRVGRRAARQVGRRPGARRPRRPPSRRQRRRRR